MAKHEYIISIQEGNKLYKQNTHIRNLGKYLDGLKHKLENVIEKLINCMQNVKLVGVKKDCTS
jgi:hypothetical protein